MQQLSFNFSFSERLNSSNFIPASENLQAFNLVKSLTEGDIISEPAVAFDSDEKEEPKSNYSLSTKSAKKTKTEQFDDLFGEDDDDLPF